MDFKDPEKVERALRAYANKLSYQNRYNRAHYEKLSVIVKKRDIEEYLNGLGVGKVSLASLKEKFPDVYRYFVKLLAMEKLKQEIMSEGENYLKKAGKWEEVLKRLVEEGETS